MESKEQHLWCCIYFQAMQQKWPIIHLDSVSKAKWQAHVKPSFWLHGDNNWRVEKAFIILSAAKKIPFFLQHIPPSFPKSIRSPLGFLVCLLWKLWTRGKITHVWTWIRRNGGDCFKKRNQKIRYKWDPCLYLSRCITSLVLFFLLWDQQWEFQCSLSLSATVL